MKVNKMVTAVSKYSVAVAGLSWSRAGCHAGPEP